LEFGEEVIVKPQGLDRCRRSIGNLLSPDSRNLNQHIVRAGLGWRVRRYVVDDEAIEEARDWKVDRGPMLSPFLRESSEERSY
jgi:hypothetical protein